MHRIDSSGATGDNKFTNGNPQTGAEATVIDADWMNAVQEEMAAIIEGEGLTLDKQDQGQLYEAIKAIVNQSGILAANPGKIEWFDEYRAPSATFPYLCLTVDDVVLDAANWPDLVPHLRTKPLRYLPGTGSAQHIFNVANFARASNVVTLTFANLTPENAVLAALAEDQLVHGSFTNWRTITLPNAISDVPAGTYDITGINPASRTLTFTHNGADASSVVTSTAIFYTHRLNSIADPTEVKARHFATRERALVSNGTEAIGGLRRRDRFQGHSHTLLGATGGGGNPYRKLLTISGDNHDATYSAQSSIGLPAQDFFNTDAGTPRTGATTDPRALVAIPYLWGRRYIP